MTNQTEALAEIRKALVELLDATEAPFPSADCGTEAQQAWAHRRSAAVGAAHKALAHRPHGAAISSQPSAPSTDEIAQRLRINRTWVVDTAWASGVGVTAISASEPFDGDPAYAMRRAVERVASEIEQQLLGQASLTGTASTGEKT